MPRKFVWLVGSRVNDCTTRMPEMSSASVAVTSPGRSRTCLYAWFDRVREHDERREREPPVEDEEHDDRPHEDERVLDEARDAVRDELVECLDVVRDPADDRARAVPLVEPE